MIEQSSRLRRPLIRAMGISEEHFLRRMQMGVDSIDTRYVSRDDPLNKGGFSVDRRVDFLRADFSRFVKKASGEVDVFQRVTDVSVALAVVRYGEKLGMDNLRDVPEEVISYIQSTLAGPPMS